MKHLKHRFDQLRVIASPEGTTILDESRKALTNWFGVNIAVRPGKPPVIQINLIAGSYDVAGVPTFLAADPAGGMPKPVKNIEFWDGTGVAFPEPPPTNVQMTPPHGGAKSADPPGVAAITPAIAGAAAEPTIIHRQMVDMQPGDQSPPLRPIDLPDAPEGKRWESDAELRARALSTANGSGNAG